MEKKIHSTDPSFSSPLEETKGYETQIQVQKGFCPKSNFKFFLAPNATSKNI